MDDDRTVLVVPPPPVRVRLSDGSGLQRELLFTEPFRIGRSHECDVQIIDTAVSKFHAEVTFDGSQWWIQDLASANGIYLDGVKVSRAALPLSAKIELGEGGPSLSVTVGEEAHPPPRAAASVAQRPEESSSVTQIIQRYLNPSRATGESDHTLLIRQAFERVTKQHSKKYKAIIAIVATLLVAAGSLAIWQHFKLQALKMTATDIFYNMKEMELQIAQLEDLLLKTANPRQAAEILAKRRKLRTLEQRYQQFVEELGLYEGLSEADRTIIRVARLFGECEVVMPKGFVTEVKQYIRKWRTTKRLTRALGRAHRNGYVRTVTKAMRKENLPPHFFYLALQESGFNPRAVGPETRYGYAKGIWQFITPTAQEFGLKPGPLRNLPRYDPEDERFHFHKATEAAARYLKHIYTTEAQASGLLVIASYNWGQGNVTRMIRQMPENPKERNFWELLKRFKIPRETYNYVFYIVSAAVIGENPRLFGFDFQEPFAEARTTGERAEATHRPFPRLPHDFPPLFAFATHLHLG